MSDWSGYNSASEEQPLPAYQQVAERLRATILSGELSSGDRLPAEADLAEQFGVSRSTVREALRVLASRDLVHTRRGVTGGTFVSELDVAHVAGYLETTLALMSGREGLGMRDMLEAREILEVPCAELAAQRRTDVHVAALRSASSHGSPEEGRFREHRSFHQLIVDAAQNPMLSMMTEPLFRVLQTRLIRPDLQPDAVIRVDEDHEAICSAIEAGDADLAGQLMFGHLVRLRDVYLDV